MSNDPSLPRFQSLFGRTLFEMMEAQQAGYVPSPVEDSIEYLSRQLSLPVGAELFSLSGDQKEIDAIIQAYDQGRMQNLTNFSKNPHSICDFLIYILNSLPQPLLHASFFNVIEKEPRVLEEIQQICHSLPETNFAVAEFLLHFLSEVLNSGVPLANLRKIAMAIFHHSDKEIVSQLENQPTEICEKEGILETEKKEKKRKKKKKTETVEVLEFLIEHVDELFGVTEGKDTDSFFADFEVVKKSGDTLVCVKRKDTSVLYSVRTIPTKTFGEDGLKRFTQEIEILKRICHPHIVALKALYQTEEFFYVLTEPVSGGDLFTRLEKLGSFSEESAITVVQQLCGALSYLHNRGIAHRAISLENVHLVKESSLEVKLAEFSLAKLISPGQMTNTTVGTPSYVAPEILLAKGYGCEVDMWSLGVLTYVLLCGFLPFFQEQRCLLFQKIIDAEFEFDPQFWSKISPSAKDFISKLLVADPQARLSARKSVNHPWLTGAPSEIRPNKDPQIMNSSPCPTEEVATSSSVHDFVSTTFFSPTWCSYCHDFLWGMRKQGFQCTICRKNLHKKCLKKKSSFDCF